MSDLFFRKPIMPIRKWARGDYARVAQHSHHTTERPKAQFCSSQRRTERKPQSPFLQLPAANRAEGRKASPLRTKTSRSDRPPAPPSKQEEKWSKMSFRAREMYKKVVRRVGGEGKLPAELMKSVKDMLPNSKVVMGRAKRGIFAGRHIQFGNKVSEDGGNK